MSTTSLVTLAAFTATVGASLFVAPLANADDGPCSVSSAVTTCATDGSASVVATPPDVSDGAQNGPYGPAGDTPPVGGKGLG